MTTRSISYRTWLYLALVFTAVMILYAQFVLGYFSETFAIPGATNSLGLSTGYSWQEVMHFLQLRSGDQLASYINFLRVWDTIFPILYTLMYSCWILFLFHKWRWVLILPATRMCIDWMENYLEISMVQEYLKNGIVSNDAVNWASSMTQIKWGLSYVIYALILVGIVIKIRKHKSISTT